MVRWCGEQPGVYDPRVGEAIVVGVATTLILAVLAWIAGVFKAGKNVRQVWTEVRRAYRDYELWAERRERQLVQRLEALDEEHAQRGTFNSGIRERDRQSAHEEAALDNKEELTKRSRAVGDAFAKLRKVDTLWMAATIKGVPSRVRLRAMWRALTKPPVELETLLEDAIDNPDKYLHN